MKNAITEISGEPAFAAPRALRAIVAGCFAAGLCVLLSACTTLRPGTGGIQAADGHQSHVIVQGADVESARRAVEEVGGEVTHTLEIIRAVGAVLSPAQLEALERRSHGLRVFPDGELQVSGRTLDTVYPTQVGADSLHDLGIDGRGVTVAFIDTGFSEHPMLTYGLAGQPRVLARYDAMEDRMVSWPSADPSGHGTHVMSVAVSSGQTVVVGDRKANGIAPNAEVVSVRAFDLNGAGRYSDVIRALGWVVANKEIFDIRILNLSFSGPVRSRYWEDPLNQAVMQAWRAGLVVVVAAGNGGPEPMTVGVPGNVPYVITVGAMTDNYTPDIGSDDYLASFSSTGPTTEGFVKPDLVAPGGHMLGLMDEDSTIFTAHPEYQEAKEYFRMSGTSQSAAVVSGVVALMLQHDTGLGPSEVKCRLMASARPSIGADGTLAYSVYQQGAGTVDAVESVFSTASGCANQGLDLDADLAGLSHFGGRANQRENDATFYLMENPADPSVALEGDGFRWDGTYFTSSSYLWSQAYLWTEGFLWTEGYLWSESYLWTEGYLWSESYLWSEGLTEAVSITQWVSQE